MAVLNLLRREETAIRQILDIVNAVQFDFYNGALLRASGFDTNTQAC